MKPVTDLLWRWGRRKRRHVYAIVGGEASDEDVEVAVAVGDDLTADAVAQRIVRDHNLALDGKSQP